MSDISGKYIWKIKSVSIFFTKMDNELPNHFQIQGNQKYTETIDSQGPLRRSLFGGVPPFINYVPAGGFTGGTEKGPQYWDANAVRKMKISSFSKYDICKFLMKS